MAEAMGNGHVAHIADTVAPASTGQAEVVQEEVGTVAEVPLGPSDVLPLLVQFWEAQAQRALTYSQLSQDFQAYLASKDEPAFRQRLEESTAAFQASSGVVRHILAVLEEAGEQPALVEGLRAVQRHEQAKLRYTLILQALKKAGSENCFSWQQSGTHSAPSQAGGIDNLGHRCAVQAEPTEAEYSNAIAEATQELQAAITAINEALEELRYAELDLRE